MSGRPTSLTPDVHRRIVAALRLGLSRSAAAAVGGVGARTMVNWLKRGEKGEEPFGEFFDAVEVAEGQAQAKVTANLMKAAADDPKIAQWWLERRHPEEWARRTVEDQNVNLSGGVSFDEMKLAAARVSEKLGQLLEGQDPGEAAAGGGGPADAARAVASRVESLSPKRLAEVEALLEWQAKGGGSPEVSKGDGV